MAKIQDKMYNRIVDGKILEISDEEISELGLAKASDIPEKLRIDIEVSEGEQYVVTTEDSKRLKKLLQDNKPVILEIEIDATEAGYYFDKGITSYRVNGSGNGIGAVSLITAIGGFIRYTFIIDTDILTCNIEEL